MGMDPAVWSTRNFNFPAELPQSGSWERYGEEFSFEGEGWLVQVLPERSEPDPAIVQVLPGANFVAYVTLEPIGPGPDGYAFLEEVVRSIAREVAGVWVDPSGSAYIHNEGRF